MSRRGVDRQGRGRVPSAVVAAAGTFPSSIANLTARYRGDLGVTITGSGVSSWADQSGNGNTLLQATDANRPTVSTTVNGHNVLTFNGSQRVTAAAQVVAGGSGTVFVVMRTTSAATTSTYAGDAPITAVGDSTGSILDGFGVGTGKVAARSFSGAWQNTNGATAVNSGAARAIGATFVASGTVTVYVDGTSDGSQAAVGAPSYAFDSVGRGFNAADSWVGDIAEVVIYGRVLTGTEIGQLAAYFRSYWGTP